MKKYYLIALFFLISINIAEAQTSARFMQNLGKGINKEIECSCVDKSGNVTIAYYSNNKRDTLVLDKWNRVNRKWSHINSMPSFDSDKKSISKCVYTKGDSLYVFAKLKFGGTQNPGLYYVSEKSIVLIGEFKYLLKNGLVTDMKMLGSKLYLFGQFDEIKIGANSAKVLHVTYFNGKFFEPVLIKPDLKTYLINDLPTATQRDTTLLISGSTILWQFVLPNQWIPVLTSDINHPFTSVTSIGNRWLVTKENCDSLIYIFNKTIVYKPINFKLKHPLQVINTTKGVLISEAGKRGRLLRLDTDKNIFNVLFVTHGIDSCKQRLLTNKTNVYFNSSVPILYNNIYFGKMAELNLDSSRNFGYDTVSVFIYNDKDGNFKKDNGENYLFPSHIYNRTYNRDLYSQTGIFKDTVPDYNNVEYELIPINNCFIQPFTGALRTWNTVKNKRDAEHDSLYFPLQSINLPKNLAIKSWAKATARIMDTISLSAKIFNKDCDNYLANDTIKVVLDSGTVYIGSTPTLYSQSGNVLTFILKNLISTQIHKINLKVLYPISNYKVGEEVKHYFTLTSSVSENKSDNTDSIVQKLVYSYDPNSKSCVPQGNISSDFRTIRYYIDFQNEGNDDAKRVTIVDSLDTKIPVYEFQMIACSHAYTVSLTNNIVTWVFDNINLPPKSVNEPMSKGFIIFEAHLKSNLDVGDSIQNKAFIYFDYNEPIVTNRALIHKIETEPVPIDTNATGQSGLLVYPNPARNILNIKNLSQKTQEVKVYNIVGQEITTIKLNALEKVIQPLDSWQQGMYILRSSLGSVHKVIVN